MEKGAAVDYVVFLKNLCVNNNLNLRFSVGNQGTRLLKDRAEGFGRLGRGGPSPRSPACGTAVLVEEARSPQAVTASWFTRITRVPNGRTRLSPASCGVPRDVEGCADHQGVITGTCQPPDGQVPCLGVAWPFLLLLSF